MSKDTDQFDFFVSYASADNTTGWVTQFVQQLHAEHAKFFPGRAPMVEFFDKKDITAGRDWEHTLHHGIAGSRLFLAFISPNYFASDWCRREWRAWIDTEIAKHILTEGVRPVYLVEVPGFTGKGTLGEQAVAQKIAELCHLPLPYDGFLASTAPVVKQVRRRQLLSDFAKPFADEGLDALRREDLHRVLSTLAQDLDHHAQLVTAAASSETTVPPYNKKFSGRLDELLELRKRLKDDQAGVVCGVHGLGGIGKTELAFTYAHAFASAYPGGRFLIPCEGRESLRQAVLCLGDFHEIRPHISDEERKTPETYFAAVARCLDARLASKGHILLVLDNVSNTALVSPQHTDCLTTLGSKLHLLATTRLLPPAGGNWLTLGELPEADALELLEKHRPFADEAERAAAGRIVKRLGGFALAVELVAAWLAAHPGSGYVAFADGLGLQDLEDIAGDQDVELRRHNHERRLSAVLGPVLGDLKPAERRILEYAALLPPDCVALPWLRELVGKDFPDAFQPTRLVADPWKEHWQRLVRLALLSRLEEETTEPRLVRVHRLVQDLVWSSAFRRQFGVPALAGRQGENPPAQPPEGGTPSGDDRTARQQAVDAIVRERDAALEKTTRWENARWELEPFGALANLWADTGHPDAAWLLNQAGQRYDSLAKWAEAEPLMRRALEIDEQSYGENPPNVARDLNNLAALLLATNRLADAEPLMRRALAIWEQSLGETHPNVASVLNNLAQLLQATNRLADAEPLMRRALQIFESSLGTEHPNVATQLNNLAQLLKTTNRLAEAEPLMRRALQIDEQSYGLDHPTVAIRLNNLARLLQDTKRLAEAEPLMRRALKIFESSLGTEHPNVAIQLNNLAQLLQDTNRLADAEPLSRRMVEILLKFTRATGHTHPHLQAVASNFTALLQAMGRSPGQIQSTLAELGQRYGVDLGGVGGRAAAQPSPRLIPVLQEIMRDQSKLEEIAARLQREDPALFQELVQFIQSQQQN